MAAPLGQVIGLARSVFVYRARPLKRWRLKRFYGRFVGPGDLAFDVGAHVGDRVGAFLALGARVVAVEPLPPAMALLRRIYGRKPGVTLVGAALGTAPGEAELLVSHGAPTVSTTDPAWAERLRTLPGFRHVRWDARAAVRVTTMDALIAVHGVPGFAKIDVEGSEPAVLRGLSRPLPALSFEYTPGGADAAIACVERLCALGDYRFNASVGETLRFVFPSWQQAPALITWLEARAVGERAGDVYAVIPALSRDP